MGDEYQPHYHGDAGMFTAGIGEYRGNGNSFAGITADAVCLFVRTLYYNVT